jgi:WD40 repeat protein
MEVEGKAKLRGFLASASVDGTAKLWDVASKQAVQTFTGHAVRTLVNASFSFASCSKGGH